MTTGWRLATGAGIVVLAAAGLVAWAGGTEPGHGVIGGGAPEALPRLVDGNARFSSATGVTPDLSPRKLQELAKGQKPFAVVLTCSDSRVPPEHLFNAGLGELFVIRLAGNVANSDAIASTEYAVAHLGTRLVVVLGHDSCGAVTAAAAGAKDTPAIEGLLGQIAPAVAIARQEGVPSGQLIERATVIHANKMRERLINQSALLKDLVRKSELKVVTGRYELATGKVNWLNLDGLSATGLAGSGVSGVPGAATTQPQAAVHETHGH